MTTSSTPDSPLARGMHHIVLYSKGRYAVQDLMTDLTTLVAERADLDPQHVRAHEIVNVLVEEVVTQWLAQPESAQRVTDFLLRFRAELLRTSGSITPAQLDELLIRQCLGYFSGRKVYDGTRMLLEIGEPDPKVLPLSHSQTKQSNTDRPPISAGTRS